MDLFDLISALAAPDEPRPMRLQVLHLPGPADEHDFALVLDRVGDVCGHFGRALENHMQEAADRVGARGAIVFRETVEVV